MGSIINGTPKGTSLCGMTPFDVLSVKIGATVSALACQKNPQKNKNEKKKTISPIHRSKTPEWSIMKICILVGLHNLVIQAKLGDDRFSHLCMVSSRISGFPIDFGCRPYNTPALLCQSVITHSQLSSNHLSLSNTQTMTAKVQGVSVPPLVEWESSNNI